VTGYGPPDDPSEAPTGFYEYGDGSGYGDGPQGDPDKSPWYRKPTTLVALALFAAILLGVAVYFLADQTHGTGETRQTPTSPTTSTTAPTTSAATTTTEPVAPPATTTMTVPPSTTEPATTAPTTPAPTTSVDEDHHHHHHHFGWMHVP
jgi:hypothetical protein